MCLGKTHAIGGLVAGLAAADLCSAAGQSVSLPGALAGGALAAGGALLNDLDTPTSTASLCAGRVSLAVSRVTRWVAQGVFDATATRADVLYGSPVHRGLTHTLLFAVFTGATTGGVVALGGRGAVFLVAFACLAPLACVMRRVLRGVPSLVPPVLVAALVAYLGLSPALVGGAVGVGVLSHALLDGCTQMGVPLFWPIRVRGMRWRRVGLPWSLRMETGGIIEPYFARTLSASAIVLLPPVLAAAKNLAVYI